MPSRKDRKKHIWSTEASYEDLDEAIDHINAKGFVLHNNHDLKCGQKFHFRCKNVPSDRRPWRDRQYLLFLPSDRPEYLVQLMKNVKKRMSPEMQDFIFGIFEKGTQR